ncbi:CYTH domain-containing protein [Oculatella sp. LEGE 06141]|uniref:CYTH domain-containing protein n=1 Tax=Oculatella sp. LEGE 06141 TaxID=1828648 RepID=UPI0018813B3F|nr:CYTH domain-containing protein [Oculatella sp. LEGE 06141]MBE9182658.1 CYTH domain-containing protein [Oculatella sp. LEGE 06141]
MAIEIERKFLVTGNDWRSLSKGIVYRQGYVSSEPGRTVRVRVAGDIGYLTIKGATRGVSRSEFEYVIPLADAEDLLENLCDRPLIEKVRYKIPIGTVVWEVDEFLGDNQGLIVAEVELTAADQIIDRPTWLGEEVSHDVRYFNASLAKHPFSRW